jgi:hypothetical protein
VCEKGNIFRKIRNKTRHACRQTARRANHLTAASANSARVPDAVQRSSRCSAEPGPMSTRARWTPDQQRTTPQVHSASKTRANALTALRSIWGTIGAAALPSSMPLGSGVVRWLNADSRSPWGGLAEGVIRRSAPTAPRSSSCTEIAARLPEIIPRVHQTQDSASALVLQLRGGLRLRLIRLRALPVPRQQPHSGMVR